MIKDSPMISQSGISAKILISTEHMAHEFKENEVRCTKLRCRRSLTLSAML